MKKLFCVFSSLVFGVIFCSGSFEVGAYGVTVDTGIQDVDRFVYELTEWVSDHSENIAPAMSELNGYMQRAELWSRVSLFSYYLTDYYNSHAVGSDLFSPIGSACSGVFQVPDDDRIYTASAFVLGESGGLLCTSPLYSMGISFSVADYDPTVSHSVSDFIRSCTPMTDAFHVGSQYYFENINNAALVIHYNGTGLFDSSTYSGPRGLWSIASYVSPNRDVPIVTPHYSWGDRAIMSTAYGNGFFTLPSVGDDYADDATPWGYYNDILLPAFGNAFPDVPLDFYPWDGVPFVPGEAEPVTDPQEYPTVPFDFYPEPVTEVVTVTVTDESGEVVTDESGDPVTDTETVIVTDESSEPLVKYRFNTPELDTIGVPSFDLPDFSLPDSLLSATQAIFAYMYDILQRSGLVGILIPVFVMGVIVYILTRLGG